MQSHPPHPVPAKDDYHQALQRIETVHGNMAVIARLGSMLREPDIGIDQVARLIHTDGALCVNIIRLSNSAFYGASSRSTTLPDALARVGYNRILSVIGAALSKRLFMHDLKAYGMSADDYWAYSYFCGVLLEEQAYQAEAPPESAYLVGLLHALGRVVLNELLITRKMEVYWDPSLPAEEWETIVVGFRHDQAGAHLLRAWKFEHEIYQRVADQKKPERIAADPLLRLLDFARRTAELNRFRVATPDWSLPSDGAWENEPDRDIAALASAVDRARVACLQIARILKGE
ncbi:MAG: HDOD domain-containing protein [Opitutaceae bacterium]|jgi:HD-like signal output (HDOD) protein|nr:HDOD domain-containing protein [Opitutaceae bacterium]